MVLYGEKYGGKVVKDMVEKLVENMVERLVEKLYKNSRSYGYGQKEKVIQKIQVMKKIHLQGI